MKVVVAPDSFKGSLTAAEAASHIADGWLGVRPDDELVLVPLADGGEGTLDALAAAEPRAVRVPVPAVTGPRGNPVDADYLLLPDGTAVVELARSSGLPLVGRPDPVGATTRGVGEVMRAALEAGAVRIVVAVGGSASTDGGAGLLRALGLRTLDDHGEELPEGGGALLRLASLDASELRRPPPGGVTVLTDVRNPLLGADGAAAVFGPQKGATPDDVRLLDRALARWAEACGVDPGSPGSGAAGGTAYGLQALWRASLLPGSEHIALLAGLPEALERADLVLTGEGRFDRTSLGGKVCGQVLHQAASRQVPVVVVCGQLPSGADRVPDVRVIALAELGGSVERALADPAGCAREGGALAARRYGG